MARILIIDDEGLVRGALTALLTQKGHAVLSARDGREGLALLKSQPPDLILLDRDLPGMTGSKVLGEIRKLNPDVRVIVLTGHPHAQGESKYRKLGISGLFSKGDDIAPLLKAIERELPSSPDILIADDDAGVRLVLRRFMEAKSRRVATAASGAEVLRLLETISPKIILLDIHMPGLDGPETLRKIRASGKDTPVIMITADEDEETARRCMALGAYDFIVKPFDLDYLELSVWAKIQLAKP